MLKIIAFVDYASGLGWLHKERIFSSFLKAALCEIVDERAVILKA